MEGNNNRPSIKGAALYVYNMPWWALFATLLFLMFFGKVMGI